jgi:predicted nucleotidyltransferase
MTPIATRRTTLDPARAERDRIMAQLREQAARLRARGICRLSLFGGVARAEAGSASDLDLLIEVDPESRFSLFDVVDLQDAARAGAAFRLRRQAPTVAGPGDPRRGDPDL